ncbi:hypothetical protein ACTHGU_07705 [Chitinophagaceae bacterium MMS25-I14]
MNNLPLNSLNHTAVLQLQIDAIVKTLTATDTDLRDAHFKRLEKIKEQSIAVTGYPHIANNSVPALARK